MYENVHHIFPTKRHTRPVFANVTFVLDPFKKIGSIHILIIPRVQNVGSFPKIKNFSNDIHKFIISALLLMHASPCIAIFVRTIQKKCERIEKTDTICKFAIVLIDILLVTP